MDIFVAWIWTHNVEDPKHEPQISHRLEVLAELKSACNEECRRTFNEALATDSEFRLEIAGASFMLY